MFSTLQIYKMIDNITMIKKTLSEIEKKNLIEKSRLECQTLNGLPYYDNRKTKNFNGGVYVKICTKNSLKITGSLHKYHSYLNSKSLTNYDSFTMRQAKETFEKLINNFGINPEKTNVTFFEVGINLKFDIDVKTILEKVHSIGQMEKLFLIEPKFKDSRQITTGTHRDYRIHFKMYDKIFEMKDSRQYRPNFDYNILRLETVHRRVEKTLLTDFIKMQYLIMLQNEFFNHWDRLNFYSDINAPKGTTRAKIELVRNIIYNGKNEVLKQYKSQYDNKALTKRQYYFAKAFIDDWDNQKNDFSLKNSQIVPIFKSSYNLEKQPITQK